MPTFKDEEDEREFNGMLKIDAAHDEPEPIEEHPCCWCNDEPEEEPCCFCGN